MTGEVTLSGKVLPVGGIKEKVLAAKRAGIKTIILPERNRKDLMEDIPAELRKGMEFIFARDVHEVIAAALQPLGAKPKAPKSGARLKTMESAPPSADIVASVPASA